MERSSGGSQSLGNPNPRLFWGTLVTVVILDVATKLVAVANLTPRQFPREVLGESVRFTLVFNPGAAFGLNLGPLSRWIFDHRWPTFNVADMAVTTGAILLAWVLWTEDRHRGAAAVQPVPKL